MTPRAAEVQALRTTLKELQAIPNVGKAAARDLVLVGVRRLEDLVDRDADVLYARLCEATGHGHDPCTRDVFAAAIAFATAGTVRPWWHYTAERKARERRAITRV